MDWPLQRFLTWTTSRSVICLFGKTWLVVYKPKQLYSRPWCSYKNRCEFPEASVTHRSCAKTQQQEGTSQKGRKNASFLQNWRSSKLLPKLLDLRYFIVFVWLYRKSGAHWSFRRQEKFRRNAKKKEKKSCSFQKGKASPCEKMTCCCCCICCSPPTLFCADWLDGFGICTFHSSIKDFSHEIFLGSDSTVTFIHFCKQNTTALFGPKLSRPMHEQGFFSCKNWHQTALKQRLVYHAGGDWTWIPKRKSKETPPDLSPEISSHFFLFVRQGCWVVLDLNASTKSRTRQKPLRPWKHWQASP